MRGRIYLPADELAAHDVDRDLLMWCHHIGAPTRGSAARWSISTQIPGASTITPNRGVATAAPTFAAVRRRRADAVLGDPGPHRGAATSRCSASAPPWATARRLQVAGGRLGHGVGRYEREAPGA